MPELVHLTSADGTPLRADLYEPEASVPLRAQIVVVHGYCEHRGRYRHVAQHLNGHGYRVLVGDLRGHGESAGERGYVERFANYIEDLEALRKGFEKHPAKNSPGLPTAVLGHSMGGLVVMAYLLARPDSFAVAAITAPFLGLKLQVPAWKRTMGLVASMLHPTLKLPNGLPASAVSHDPEVVRLYETDPLITHNATARWFTETVSTQADVRMRVGRLQTPLLMQIAGDDRIVDSATAETVFGLVGSSDKKKIVYDGLFHEILNEREPDRQKVLADLSGWLDAHLPVR